MARRMIETKITTPTVSALKRKTIKSVIPIIKGININRTSTARLTVVVS